MAGRVIVDRVLDVFTSGRDAEKSHNESVRVRVYVDPTAPRELILAVKETFVAARPGGIVDVLSLEGGYFENDVTADVILVIPGRGGAAADAIGSYARRGTHVGVVVESSVEVPYVPVGEDAAALVSVISAADAAAVPDKIATWLVGVTGKGLAFAACFPFLRNEEVASLINRCALENTAVGAVSLIPGSDMPIMTANQAKLALDIAAAYGQGVEPSRALDLLGVLCAGLAYRAAARSLVALVPGLGWMLKAGMGYAGTIATGHAIKTRFDVAAGDADGVIGRGCEAMRSARDVAGQIVHVPDRVTEACQAHEAARTSERVDPAPRPGGFDYLVIGEDGVRVGE